jgi:hypothetical protein
MLSPSDLKFALSAVTTRVVDAGDGRRVLFVFCFDVVIAYSLTYSSSSLLLLSPPLVLIRLGIVLLIIIESCSLLLFRVFLISLFLLLLLLFGLFEIASSQLAVQLLS